MLWIKISNNHSNHNCLFLKQPHFWKLFNNVHVFSPNSESACNVVSVTEPLAKMYEVLFITGTPDDSQRFEINVL